MKYTFSIFLFYFFLLLFFILNGFGIRQEWFQYSYALLCTPFILFFVDFIQGKQYRLPIVITFIQLTFLILVSISTVQGIHFQRAFEQQLIYMTIFLLFIYVYNHQQEIKECLLPFIKVISVLTIAYSLGLLFFVPTVEWLVPVATYQLVYKKVAYVSHHPLGVFLLIPTIISIYFFIQHKSIKNLIITLFLLTGILFSYARAAYIALIVGITPLIFQKRYFKKLQLIFVGIVTILVFIFLLLSTGIKNQLPILKSIQTKLYQHGDLQYKPLFGARDKYFSYALQGFYERPWFGYGSDNFNFIGKQFANSDWESSNSSHNLVLDVLSENGVFTFIVYVTILVLLVHSGWKTFKSRTILNKGLFGVFIGLLVAFQLTFYYKVHVLYLFFFVIGAVLYSEKREVVDKYKLLLIFSLFIALINVIILTANYLHYNKQSNLARTLYPISSDVYPALIREEFKEGNQQQLIFLLQQYNVYYPHEPAAQNFIGTVYALQDKDKKAKEHFSRALNSYPRSFYAFNNMYHLIKDIEGEEKAKEYQLKSPYKHISHNFIDESRKFCLQTVTGCEK